MVQANLRRLLAILITGLSAAAVAAPLETASVATGRASGTLVAEGVVEAVRASNMGVEMPGRVTALAVQAGDHVAAGQVLLRIDERVAALQAQASHSQGVAAEALLIAARAEYERKRKLQEKGFLSKGALDQAEADFRSSEAQARAQMAQAAAAGVQTGLHTLTAPYGGVVAETNVQLGDMVVPGKTLLVVYDPGAMRVTVNVPQSQVPALKGLSAQVEIPGAIDAPLAVPASRITLLPTADPGSHMVQVRIELGEKSAGLTPGMFARAWFAVPGIAGGGSVSVPARAVIRRGELTAVYVVDGKGAATLRQVRLGLMLGERVEVLAGVEGGEKVALDPLAAAKQR